MHLWLASLVTVIVGACSAFILSCNQMPEPLVLAVSMERSCTLYILAGCDKIIQSTCCKPRADAVYTIRYLQGAMGCFRTAVLLSRQHSRMH